MALFRKSIVYLDNGQAINIIQGYSKILRFEGNIISKSIFTACVAELVQNLHMILHDCFARDVQQNIVRDTRLSEV